jgi:hypothetical protein
VVNIFLALMYYLEKPEVPVFQTGYSDLPNRTVQFYQIEHIFILL